MPAVVYASVDWDRYDTERAMQIEPLKAKLATFDSRQAFKLMLWR